MSTTKTQLLTTICIAAAAVAATTIPTASASELIDRNATKVRLQVNRSGQAMVSYRAAGRTRHVLVWGAVGARRPSTTAPQVAFRKDYSGGWAVYRRTIWRGFPNACRRYDGPHLPFFVAGCKASDGSYWALQSWQVPLPDLGFTPWTKPQAARELHLAHWAGPTAKLEAWTDWIYGGRFQEVFGRLTYLGEPVSGYGTTRFGAPTDDYGRLVYLDTLDSAYGPDWRRENSFVTHKGTGVFCYGFYTYDPSSGGYPKPASWPAHKLRGPGTGKAYRLSVIGPGVTPDVSLTVPGLHSFDARNPSDVAYEQQQNAVLDQVAAKDGLCHQH